MSDAKKRRSYSVTFKIEAVDFAEKNTNEAAAKKYGVDTKQLREWKKIKMQLKELNQQGVSKRKRLEGAGRQASNSLLEEQLHEWIKNQREQALAVSRKRIKTRARQLHDELKANGERVSENFTASNGWLGKFMKRFNLTMRRSTTVAQKAPLDYISKIVDFTIYIRKLLIANKYDQIFACDETPVWLEMPGTTTIETRGVKDVPVRSTGHEKTRITVMLTARKDGRKCKPYILLPIKRPLKELTKFNNKLYIEYAGKSWMDNTLTLEYLDKIIGQFSLGKRLLVWDSFRAHISKEVKVKLRKMKVDTAVVPGGCTKFVQPPDVSWNRPFKAKISEMYDNWIAMGGEGMTKGGNPKAPSWERICEWVVAGWESVSDETIKHSFTVCGINATDGSEDTQIVCMRPGALCHGGLEILQEKHNELMVELRNQPDTENYNQPEPEPEDDYENSSDSDSETEY